MSTCSLSSHSSGEQLFATASRVDFWFLLEHPETYGEKAFPHSALPLNVKNKLEAAVRAVPHGRIQLIKRARNPLAEARRFFIAVNHEEDPALYAFHLERVSDLLALDLHAITREDPVYRTHRREDPLFLVCTNGRRDPCCSRLGLPLYRHLRRTNGHTVWQSAHVGGHRFAPNLVALPSGAFYGYADEDAAGRIVSAVNSGSIHLPNYRGRSCYAPVVQAADAFLREETGQNALLRYRLVELEPIAEGTWMCRFADRIEGDVYCIKVQREREAVTVQKSCREAGPVLLSQFRLKGYEVYHAVTRMQQDGGQG